MIDEVNFDMGCPLTTIDQGGTSLPPIDTFSALPIDEGLSSLRSSQRKFRSSIFKLDLSTARRERDVRAAAPVATTVQQLDEKVTSATIETIKTTPEKSKDHADKSKNHKYTHNQAGIGRYLLGIGEMLLGGTLMITGAVIEIGSLGTLTIAVGFQEAAGFALITDGFARTIRHSPDISFASTKYKPEYTPNEYLNIMKGERKNLGDPGSPPVRGEELVGDGKRVLDKVLMNGRGKGLQKVTKEAGLKEMGKLAKASIRI